MLRYEQMLFWRLSHAALNPVGNGCDGIPFK